MTETVSFGVTVTGTQRRQTESSESRALTEQHLYPTLQRLVGLQMGISEISAQQKFFDSRKSFQNDRMLDCTI